MKLPNYQIWVDEAIYNDFSVVVVAQLSQGAFPTTIDLKVLEIEILNLQEVSKIERIIKLNEKINEFKIKYNLADEFIQKVQTTET